MNERPIIFNTDMVQAILDERKTATRRVIKPQPESHHWEMFNGAEYPDGRKYKHHMNLIECQRGQFLHSWHSLGDHIDSSEECNQRILCPYGKPGDLLYVRETWARGCKEADPYCHCYTEELQKENHYYVYKADTPDAKYPLDWDDALADEWVKDCLKDADFVPRWKPSIHMPKSASRIWLRVKDVRVERVQDITRYDIEQEGVDVVQGWDTIDVVFAKWIELWDSINSKRGYGWDVNPWIWVVLFEVISTTGRPEE